MNCLFYFPIAPNAKYYNIELYVILFTFMNY